MYVFVHASSFTSACHCNTASNAKKQQRSCYNQHMSTLQACKCNTVNMI